MMRLLILIVALVSTIGSALGQSDFQSLIELEPESTFDNIHIKRVSGDSLSTAFVIWIKSHVPLHYHAHHSENVYILSGEGTMRLGETNFTIGQGDHVFVPQNTAHGVTVKSDNPLKVLSIQSPHFDGTDRILLE